MNVKLKMMLMMNHTMVNYYIMIHTMVDIRIHAMVDLYHDIYHGTCSIRYHCGSMECVCLSAPSSNLVIKSPSVEVMLSVLHALKVEYPGVATRS